AMARGVVAVRESPLKLGLQADEIRGRLRGEPERRLALSVREVAQLAEGRAKRLDRCASAPKLGVGLVEICARPERIKQRNVRHPALQVRVVPPTDGLNGLPNIARGNHHDSSMMRLVHKFSSQRTMRAGSSSRFSLVTCHSSASGRRLTSAMKPAPRWA